MKINPTKDYLKERAEQVNQLYLLGYSKKEIMERLKITVGEYQVARKILKRIA